MTDDLIAQLRAAGHDAEADSIERKLGGGPDSERDGIDSVGDSPEPAMDASGSDHDAEVAAVVAALDRDIPDWRG